MDDHQEARSMEEEARGVRMSDKLKYIDQERSARLIVFDVLATNCSNICMASAGRENVYAYAVLVRAHARTHAT